LNDQTPRQYDQVIDQCRTLFLAKTHDYGTAWRILRLPSITDQIFIKAQRIRSIQEKGTQLVQDPIDDEFVAIVNYCVIALMQLHLPADAPLDLDADAVAATYDEEVAENRQLLFAKNHDYGEAWRQMRVSSITDIILMKLHRTKQIEDLHGRTLASEGVEANYRDMLNYAVFALILRGAAAEVG
jgi:Nucleotide modification associated domain 1